MPRAPRKCPKPGCEERITNTRYCPEHTEHHWINGGNPRTTSPAHRAWAAHVLQRDQHTCLIRRRGCIGHATTADHVIPVHLGGAEYDPANGQAACRPCHAKKSSEEGQAARRAQRTKPSATHP